MSAWSEFLKLFVKGGKTSSRFVKPAVEEGAKLAKEGAKGAKEVFEEGARMAKAGEEIASAGTAGRVIQEAGKSSKKGLSGWFSGNFKENVQTVKNVTKIPFYAAAGVPAVAIASSATKSWAEGNGILHGAMTSALGQEATEKIEDNGIAGGVKNVLFGREYDDDAIAPAFVKNIFGDASIDNAKNLYHGMVGQLSGGQNQPIPQLMGYDSNGQPIYGIQPESSAVQPSSGPFGSINNMVSNITGGKLDAMNAVELIAAAYMMFSSRFGWMGKIGSILLGGNVAKDMQARQQAQLLASQQFGQQQVLMPPVAVPMYQDLVPEENVVSRMRR